MIKRGWLESSTKSDETVDLKFTLCHTDINLQLSKGIINHCRGENSLTAKTMLIDTLNENQTFWASWLADLETGEAKISLTGYD